MRASVFDRCARSSMNVGRLRRNEAADRRAEPNVPTLWKGKVN